MKGQKSQKSNKLSAQSAFSYSCTRCSACCYNKKIQINPYEIARLAKALQMSFAEIRDNHTIEGVMLIQKCDGACEFLGDNGCTVHADRPLVCRIFPLGRHINESGEIHYSKPKWNPMPNGDFNKNGVVQDYVDDQGVAQFAYFADEYFKWYCKARDYLARVESDNLALPYEDLLNVDAVVSQYCNINLIDKPIVLEDTCQLHIKILYELLMEATDGKN